MGHVGLFVVAALTLLVIPGPAVMYIVTRSSAHGRRTGLVSVAGIHTATCVHVAAAVLGLSAVLAASAAAFTVVRIAGGIYLIALGIRAWRGRRSPAVPGSAPARHAFRDGFVVNVANPKTALFFLAFLPQFVDPAGAPAWLQTLGLGGVFIALGLVTDSLYAVASASLGRRLAGHCARRRTAAVEGGLLIGLGVLALTGPRPARAQFRR
jgi:threonine/homoserine/homoserine lactone efflux protein